MLKLVVFCPDDDAVVQKVISAASTAGAGVLGYYTGCAFIAKGTGQWFSGEGTHPTIGAVGELTRHQEVRIEMQCPDEKAGVVRNAVKSVHPYEEPAIEFYSIVSI